MYIELDEIDEYDKLIIEVEVEIDEHDEIEKIDEIDDVVHNDEIDDVHDDDTIDYEYI